MNTQTVLVHLTPETVENRNQFEAGARQCIVERSHWSTNRIKKGPTRNLFPGCQDDSACTVGASPDHYGRGQSSAEKKSLEHRWRGEYGSKGTATGLPSVLRSFSSFTFFVIPTQNCANRARRCTCACSIFVAPPTHLSRAHGDPHAGRSVAPNAEREPANLVYPCYARNNRSVYFSGHVNRRLLILHRSQNPGLVAYRLKYSLSLSLPRDSIIDCHGFVILTLVFVQFDPPLRRWYSGPPVCPCNSWKFAVLSLSL